MSRCFQDAQQKAEMWINLAFHVRLEPIAHFPVSLLTCSSD